MIHPLKSFLVVLLSIGLAGQAAAQKPNIIIIYTDDVGYGDIGCYGMQRIQTPNIDRLAKQGLRFTNAHSTSATCTPSRYALLTGQYPWRKKGTGIAPGDAALIIPADKITLPGMLQKAGYTTGIVGKWHLGLGPSGGPDWNGDIKPGPLEVGFNYSFIMPATADRVPCVYVEDHRIINLDSNDPIKVSYTQPIGNEPTGKEHPELLSLPSTPGNGHNQTIINGIGRIGYMTGGNTARWKDEDMAATFTAKAVSFISNHRQQPFFLYFATNDIHVPRWPNKRFVGKSGMGLRGDAILQMDWAVGRLLHTLDSLQLTQNTLIIFSSDNGPVVDDGYLDGSVENLGNHKPAGPLRGGKYSAFDAGTRVPMVVQWPGHVSAGKTTDALFSQVDLFASLAAFTGQSLLPSDASDSFDMLSTLLGSSAKARPYIIEDAGTFSIIKGHWKYILPGNGPARDELVNIELGNSTLPQLYNLQKDPHEQHNVAAENAGIVNELDALLKQVQQQNSSRN